MAGLTKKLRLSLFHQPVLNGESGRGVSIVNAPLPIIWLLIYEVSNPRTTWVVTGCHPKKETFVCVFGKTFVLLHANWLIWKNHSSRTKYGLRAQGRSKVVLFCSIHNVSHSFDFKRGEKLYVYSYRYLVLLLFFQISTATIVQMRDF